MKDLSIAVVSSWRLQDVSRETGEILFHVKQEFVVAI